MGIQQPLQLGGDQGDVAALTGQLLGGLCESLRVRGVLQERHRRSAGEETAGEHGQSGHVTGLQCEQPLPVPAQGFGGGLCRGSQVLRGQQGLLRRPGGTGGAHDDGGLIRSFVQEMCRTLGSIAFWALLSGALALPADIGPLDPARDAVLAGGEEFQRRCLATQRAVQGGQRLRSPGIHGYRVYRAVEGQSASRGVPAAHICASLLRRPASGGISCGRRTARPPGLRWC